MPHRPSTPPTFPTGGVPWWDIFQLDPRLAVRYLFGFFRELRRQPFGDGGFGDFFPPERLLPPGAQTQKLELLTSALNRPVPLAYGRHIVGGNVLFQQEEADGLVRLFIALGEGEWDGIERLWVNGAEFDHTDTDFCHFHPGAEGELALETDPAARNQKVCSFFPSGFTPPLTFSRTAYLALKLRREPTQPGPEFHVLGIYRTLRVRDFDATGFTGYGYSVNPARIALDLLLRRFLFPHSKANETPPSSVTDRIDFAAWNDWKNFCDADLTINGDTINRFDASPAFVDATDLLRALEWLLLLGRGYLLERNGQFAPFADEPRSSVLAASRDTVAAGSLQLSQRPLRNSPNRFTLRYRALDSGRGLGTITSSGATVTGSGTLFTQFFQGGQSLQLLDGPQAGESRPIDAIVSDTELKIASAFSADQSAARKYSNPSLDFMVSERVVEDEDRQDEVGRSIEAAADLGNVAHQQAERLAEYLSRRSLRLSNQLRCRLLPAPATGGSALDLLPGDVIEGPADLNFENSNFKYEILEISDEPDGSRELLALEYDESVFTDAASPPLSIWWSPFPGGGINPNAPQMPNVLQNGSFFRSGVAGQEGTTRPKHWQGYSNTGAGPPAWPTDLEHDLSNDKVKLKTSTSSVDKIGVRTLWSNLGKVFKPGQRVGVAVSLRHTGGPGRYDKQVKLKLDSDAEDYNRPDGSDYVTTIKAGLIPNFHIVRFGYFTLRADQAVPDALNVFLWSEATAASPSNFDLEVDYLTFWSGRVPPAFEPRDEIPDADITWNSGAGLYNLPAYLTKEGDPPSGDPGGGGGAGGGGADSGGDGGGGHDPNL